MLISACKREFLYKNNKFLMWSLIAILAVQTWIISFFSSQPATESAEVSGIIVEKLKQFIVFIAGDEYCSEDSRDLLQFIVRKLAHIYNFFVIGCTVSVMKVVFSQTISDCLWVSYGLALAVFDECHQLFVPGRGGQLSDVCVDFMGVLLGYVTICLIYRMVCWKRCE